jgi:hypothetical protein
VTHTGPTNFKFNAKTCLMTGTLKGTFKVSGETGAYKGISGSGKYTGTLLGIAAKTKTGACDQNAAPVAFQQVVDASGTIKLP